LRDGDKLGFPVFPLAYTNEETGGVSLGYKESGYFSDAFINMLSLLGWNPGTEKELFSIEELITTFDLSRVSKSGAKFSLDKTNWFNQQYLQKKTAAELALLFPVILKNKKKLFYFFRYLVGTFLKVFYKSFCVEGFMVMFKGKFSTLVGGRKKIFKCFFSKISSTKYLCYFKWVNIKTTTKLGVTNIKILCTFL